MAHRILLSRAYSRAATPALRSSYSSAAAAAAALSGGSGGAAVPEGNGRRRWHRRRGIASCTRPTMLAAAGSGGGGLPAVDRAKVDRVFEKILALDLIEVHLVTELLSEKLGIDTSGASSAAAASASSAAAAGGAEAKEEVKEEKRTKFDLKLVGFDAKAKIKVIKEVRTMTGLGLKDAKEMVEGAPKVIAKDVKKEEIEEMKAKLEGVGATVEIV